MMKAEASTHDAVPALKGRKCDRIFDERAAEAANKGGTAGTALVLWMDKRFLFERHSLPEMLKREEKSHEEDRIRILIRTARSYTGGLLLIRFFRF
jgi:hypothetical protein